MNSKPLIVRILQVILATLFLAWLGLLYTYPVQLNPDSYGYLADAKNLFVPDYVTIRPMLYPAYLRLMGGPGTRLSIICFLINSASLLYLVHISSGRRRLFSGRNTIVLIGYLLLTAIWSYCGTCLTESILFSVQLWIFVFITKIFFPNGRQNPLLTVLYSLCICALSISLKPWLMIMVLLSSALLFLASLRLKAFRSHRRSSFILLAVSVLSFVLALPYSRSKSAESANMVVLMISSGNEEDLRARLKEDTGMNSNAAEFLRSLLSDIELINGKYKRNPWVASSTNELKLLNISDKRQVPSINKAFHVMYFEHAENILGLVGLSFERYIAELRLGLSCLDIAYGPELPGIRSSGISIVLICSGLLMIYMATRRMHTGNKMAGIKGIWLLLKGDRELAIFTGITLLAAFCFGLFLSLAGADELRRTVLPAALFELFPLTYIILKTEPAGIL